MLTEEKRKLELEAANIRKTALETIHTAGSGHIGGSFSMAEIMAVLYFKAMNIDPKDPEKADRDRLVLSKGHCSPVMYATLARRGFFPIDHLKTFRKIDSDLSGHVEIHVPGVDMSGGSLGQGLSVAVGMAMYAKSNNVGNYVYAIMGDGEIQEGQIWEAAMSAGFFKVNNLIAFVDNNKIQLDGRLSEIMDPNPIDEKFRAFNWNVISVNGQDVEEIANAIDEAKKSQDKPTMILAHTTKGAGVSVFEDTPRFHGGQPTPEEYELAIKELNDRIASLEV
ncbi:MAG: transketolase [Lachnospiraceae bacterium]|nr:transketolase [Lachnospiraceae bacterium]